MSKSYLYSFVLCLLLTSFVFAEECSLETGTCGGSENIAARVGRATAGYGCVASINIAYIPDTARFEVIDGNNRIVADYQLTVTNTGPCVVSGASIQIDVPGGAAIISTTNLDRSASQQEGAYDLVLRTFNTLPPGSTYTNSSFSASFVSSGYARVFEATIVAQCDNCNTPIGTSASCRAETAVTLRPESSGFNSTSGKYYGVYDVLIINIGACGIFEVGLDFSLPPGVAITKATGLVQTYGVGQYKATGFRNNQVRLMQGDRLPVEVGYTSSLTAEFSTQDAVIQRLTVDSTSFCQSSCDGSLTSPAPTRGQCAAIVVASWIQGSPRVVLVNGVNRIATDYEILVANYGVCPITSVTVTFAPYSGSDLTNATNLQPTGQPNQYTITFPAPLSAPGSTSNRASITAIFQSSGYAYQVPVSTVTPQCSDCSDRTPSTSAPVTSSPVTSSPSTSSPVTPSPSTSSPVTSSPSTPSPTPGGSCAVTVTFELRTTWKSGSTDNRLYDLIISNTGSSTVQYVDIAIIYGLETTVTQSWNLAAVSQYVYKANLFAAAPGHIVRSSGYVLTNEETSAFTQPIVTVVSPQCEERKCTP